MTAAGAAAPPTVWVLHGQPDTSATWWATRRYLLEAVAAAGVAPPEVRVPDRPGYGHHRSPATDYAGNVAWLRGELDRSGAERVVLVGHSWGGGIAVLAAAADPRVVGIALLASVGPDCLVATDRLFEVPGLGEPMSWVALGPGAGVWRRYLRRKVRERIDPADAPYARSTAWANRLRPVWRSFVVEQRALLRELPQIVDALPRVQVPALVVAGRDDHVIPPATPAGLVAALPRATRVDLPAGHDLNLSAPQATGQALAAWLLSDVLATT
ncbi:alpha/beta fold hydrolase [Jatrophihabitans sp. YIM 134969]